MMKFHIHKMMATSSGKLPLSVNLTLPGGKITALYGPSGAGKTTLLKIIAGLTEPDHGVITIDGKTWFDSSAKQYLKVQKRKVGFVFQEYALFGNMTVKGNLQYAKREGTPDKVIGELIEVMDLQHLLDRYPGNLSGGQKQRVALSRAIISNPDLLLLDEPLSALDSKMRITLQDHLLQLQKEMGFSVIMVSHDIPEIFKMAEHVISIREGKVSASGSPEEVFTRQKLSSKFRATGEVLEISKQDIIYVITVLTGKDIVKVVVTEQEARSLKQGDKILISSKAFNPVITLLEDE